MKQTTRQPESAQELTMAHGAQELTMRVYVKQEDCKTRFILGTNGKQVAYIEKDDFNKGRYFGMFHPVTATLGNAGYPECVKSL